MRENLLGCLAAVILIAIVVCGSLAALAFKIFVALKLLHWAGVAIP
jgi:hypothetical protein